MEPMRMSLDLWAPRAIMVVFSYSLCYGLLFSLNFCAYSKRKKNVSIILLGNSDTGLCPSWGRHSMSCSRVSERLVSDGRPGQMNEEQGGI